MLSAFGDVEGMPVGAWQGLETTTYRRLAPSPSATSSTTPRRLTTRSLTV